MERRTESSPGPSHSLSSSNPLALLRGLQLAPVFAPPGQYMLQESPGSCPHCPQPILPKCLGLNVTTSGENTHLGSSCLATLTKSSPSNPAEAGMERRRGKRRGNMKPVQDGIWVECQGTTQIFGDMPPGWPLGFQLPLCLLPTAVCHLLPSTPEEATVWGLKK